MDFIFQGFQSTLPVWAYLLIFAACSFSAWWSYNSIKGISKSSRYLLITLRSFVFFILLALLLNPFFKAENRYSVKSKITVMLDNSASTAIDKEDYRGTESYKKVIDALNFKDSSSVNFEFFSIGSEVTPSSPGSLSFDDARTNLSNAVDLINENAGEANAAIIITDGIYTEGQNPIFDASDADIPVFTIGLGDTTSQRDMLVKSVTTNSRGYLNTRQTVRTTVSAEGFKGQPFKVQLQKGDEVIQSKSITPQISSSNNEVVFELPLNEEGLQQFAITIPELTDEWTAENNKQRFAIDVLDAKQQILSIAFEIHPDVGFIRSLLLSDQHIQLTKRTWLGGDRFIEGDWSFNPDTVDLAVIHGYPSSGLSQSLQKRLADMAEKVPLIITAAPKFNPQAFAREITSLPVNATAAWDYSPGTIRPETSNHPILELPSVPYDHAPQLFAPIQNADLAPASEAIFTGNFQGQPTSGPVLVVRQLGNKRMALFTAYGWYRLSQTPNAALKEFVNRLWLNTVSWAATDPENQKLKVQPEQTSFSETEPVVINAYLKNERGEVEPGAMIDLSVASNSDDTTFYSLENRGAGEYRLNLGAMPEGVYSFKATATKEGRQLGTQSGEFAVARSNEEFTNIERNDQLLRQLAQRTGGDYVPFDSIAGFWDRLYEQGLLEQTQEVETTFWYPYQHLFWFLLVVILLSAEWVFRKYLSLP